MKKNIRRTMMLSSLAMLIVAVLALGTATYAWFTASNKGYISNIQFQATSADGIQLSTNGENWTSNLDFSDFNITNTVLSAVSTTGAVNSNGHFDMYAASLNPETGLFSTQGTTSGYYMLTFYIYNSGTSDITVFLNNESDVADGTVDKNTADATRIGVVKWAAMADYSDNSATMQENLAALTGDNSAISFIYEPGTTVVPYYGVNGVAAGLNPVDPSTTPHIIMQGQTGVPATATTVQTQLTNTTTSLGTIGAGKVAHVELYIWIEGQDINCNNGVASGDVVINLTFEKYGA